MKCALAHPAPGTNTLPQIDISGHNQNSNCPQIIKSSRAVTKVLLILLGNAAFCKAFLEKSLFFIFRFACVQKKNVPRHILAPSAVARDDLHLRASAHHWHVVPFCSTGKFHRTFLLNKKSPAGTPAPTGNFLIFIFLLSLSSSA